MRWIALTLTVAAIGSGSTAVATGTSGPPPGLTTSGRVIWNLDALLNDTFGGRFACFDSKRFAIFSVAHGKFCPSPAARYQAWDFTFLDAHGSQFRLVYLAKEPQTGVTNVAVRVGSRYVSCPNGQYHHGGRGWVVFGGHAGPTGLFWCN